MKTHPKVIVIITTLAIVGLVAVVVIAIRGYGVKCLDLDC